MPRNYADLIPSDEELYQFMSKIFHAATVCCFEVVHVTVSSLNVITAYARERHHHSGLQHIMNFFFQPYDH